MTPLFCAKSAKNADREVEMLENLDLRHQVKTTQFCIIVSCILTSILLFQVIATQREVKKNAIAIDETTTTLMQNRKILQDFIKKFPDNQATKSLP